MSTAFEGASLIHKRFKRALAYLVDFQYLLCHSCNFALICFIAFIFYDFVGLVSAQHFGFFYTVVAHSFC